MFHHLPLLAKYLRADHGMESGTATSVNVSLVVLLIACLHWEILFLTGQLYAQLHT
jgi:hypothetical protein